MWFIQFCVTRTSPVSISLMLPSCNKVTAVLNLNLFDIPNTRSLLLAANFYGRLVYSFVSLHSEKKIVLLASRILAMLIE